MPTLNYTTTIAPVKTIGEIQSLLADSGANAVATRYVEGKAVGVTFTLVTAHGERAFTLPVDVPAMYRLLQKQVQQRKIRPGFGTYDQAERVSWRVVKDWLAAQLALVQAEMATFDQVMLPYLHVDGDRTLYEAFRERETLALEAAPSNVRELRREEAVGD